jgi:hypothetical protein
MNNGKVLLPREVAEAIENVRKRLGWADEVILYKTYTNGWEAEWTKVLNVDDDENKAFLIAQALINGYEIEKSPEDNVRELYDKALENYAALPASPESAYYDGLTQGVLKTLEALDIKIPGVNA